MSVALGAGVGVGVRAGLREPASAFELASTLGAATSAGRGDGHGTSDPAGFLARATSTGRGGDTGELASSLAPKVGGDSIGNAAIGIEGRRDTGEAFVVGRFTPSTGRNATRAGGADVGSADGDVDGLRTDEGAEATIAFGPGVGGAGRTANEAGRCVEAGAGGVVGGPAAAG